MINALQSIEDVNALIESGKTLFLAGDEQALKQLKPGNWIGGTIPYFMAETGGEVNRDKIFVTEVPEYVTSSKISAYDAEQLKNVYNDTYANGFSLILIPAMSDVHFSFALNAPEYPSFGKSPLVGWITGVHLDDLGKVTPKVFNGVSGSVSEKEAYVLHCELPANRYASLDIVNLFDQGEGDTLVFKKSGWDADTVVVNGKEMSFVEYVEQKGLDTRLPLVADYSGAKINVSFQSVDKENGKVVFYAPVFEGMEYRQAANVGNYVKEFTAHLPRENTENIAFSCNCILNFLYSELEGKQTGHVKGPITFGEVAYQLLNQTLAYLSINEISSN